MNIVKFKTDPEPASKSRPYLRRGLAILLLPLILLTISERYSYAGIRQFTLKEIDLLTEKLISDELTEPYLRKVFKNPAFRKLSRASRLNITKPVNLTHNRYKHFLEPYAIKKAEKFSRTWRTVLKNAEQRFGVDRDVIVAVLLVETSLGTIKGRYLLPSVFASLYVDSKKISRTTNKKLSERSSKKGAWALKQLRVLLKLGKEGVLNIFHLKGSYAGAFGLPQFLPSSYLNWAVRHEGSESPNLFWEPDAISSLANYLKAHGYRNGNEVAKNRKAIWAYNHSEVYVDTVLGVATRLKGGRRKIR